MSTATAEHAQNGMTRHQRQTIVVEDHGVNSYMMDTGKFEHLQRIASAMSNSSLLPDHLRLGGTKGNKRELSPDTVQANCFRVVNQAMRWQMDPFAVIDETYVVGGKLGYQGKLVAAVVNARAGLEGRLRYEFEGTGQNLTCRVVGLFKGEAEPRTVDLSLSDAKTDNQMWKKDPHQKLIYSAVVKWARRHCPEIVLGVLTDDDLERIRMERDTRPAIAVDPSVPKTDRLTNMLRQNRGVQDDSEPKATAEEPTEETDTDFEAEEADAVSNDESPIDSKAARMLEQGIKTSKSPEQLDRFGQAVYGAEQEGNISADEAEYLRGLLRPRA